VATPVLAAETSLTSPSSVDRDLDADTSVPEVLYSVSAYHPSPQDYVPCTRQSYTEEEKPVGETVIFIHKIFHRLDKVPSMPLLIPILASDVLFFQKTVCMRYWNRILQFFLNRCESSRCRSEP